MEMSNRIREALHCGLKVLEDAFEILEYDHTAGEGMAVTTTQYWTGLMANRRCYPSTVLPKCLHVTRESRDPHMTTLATIN